MVIQLVESSLRSRERVSVTQLARGVAGDRKCVFRALALPQPESAERQFQRRRRAQMVYRAAVDQLP